MQYTYAVKIHICMLFPRALFRYCIGLAILVVCVYQLHDAAYISTCLVEHFPKSKHLLIRFHLNTHNLFITTTTVIQCLLNTISVSSAPIVQGNLLSISI